jgi:hypothetical protein
MGIFDITDFRFQRRLRNSKLESFARGSGVKNNQWRIPNPENPKEFVGRDKAQ